VTLDAIVAAFDAAATVEEIARQPFPLSRRHVSADTSW
jgi:hypothetical protein